MSDFVIQEHTTNTGIHWDLMIRAGEVLLTWQVGQPPELWGGSPLNCQRIFDHRLKYLTYEGPISDNRGSVRIVAKGKYKGEYQELTGIIAGQNFDCLAIEIFSPQLTGKLDLICQHDQHWTLTLNQ